LAKTNKEKQADFVERQKLKGLRLKRYWLSSADGKAVDEFMEELKNRKINTIK